MVSIKNNKEMTQQEFEEKTGMTPSIEEFDYIHAVYMDTFMDKEEFCKDFKSMATARSFGKSTQGRLILNSNANTITNYSMKWPHSSSASQGRIMIPTSEKWR